LLLIIPCYWLGGEPGIYWGWAVAGVLPLLLTWIVAAADGEWRRGRLLGDVNELRQMLREMWVFVWGVVGQALLQNLDRFIIAWLLGAAAVGAYFKVTNTAYLIVVPVEPLAGLLLSMVAQEQLGRRTLRQLQYLHRFMLIIIGGVLLLGVVLGQPLTDLLYGVGTFAAGARLYWLVLAGCACAIVSILLRGLVIVYVPLRWIIWHDTLSLLALAVSSVVLTWRYGLAGAAMAVLAGLALRALLSEAVVWLTVRRKLRT
jgi:O-antigen/teichoic acid export membrane protein